MGFLNLNRIAGFVMLAGIMVMPSGISQAQEEAEASTMDTTLPWKTPLQWTSSGILVNPHPREGHEIVSVKDPTVVHHDGEWHIYCTVYNTTDSKGWRMQYINFEKWEDADEAVPFFTELNPNLNGYHCAPQIFYFTPHQKWYFIFQSQQPQYTTLDDLSEPWAWPEPKDFYEGRPEGLPRLPIDYWVICDDTHAYLFFTGDNGRVYKSRTTIGAFPKGMSDPEVVIEEDRSTVFEGSMTYKLKGYDKYLTLVEGLGRGGRYYSAWLADDLNGEWHRVEGAHGWDTPFAGVENVRFAEGVEDWTNDVSHGEILRISNDEKMEIDPHNIKLLYQGMDPEKGGVQYGLLPYRLGILTLETPVSE